MGHSGGLWSDRPLFTGSAEHNLDDKGRLVVPARFRERLGAGFFLGISIAAPDPCLVLYPASAFGDISARVDAEAEKTGDFRAFVRHWSASTEEVSTDAQGRLVIPAHLRAHAGIDKEVLSLGVITHVELWAKDRYAAYRSEHRDLPDFAAKLGVF